MPCDASALSSAGGRPRSLQRTGRAAGMDSDTRLRMSESVPGREDQESGQQEEADCAQEPKCPEKQPECPCPEKEPECCPEEPECPCPEEPVCPGKGSSRSSSLHPAKRGSSQRRSSKSKHSTSTIEEPCPDASGLNVKTPSGGKGGLLVKTGGGGGGLLVKTGAGAGPGAAGTKAECESPLTLRVLVDMDGTVVDFEAAALRLWTETYPEEPYVALEERRGYSIQAQYAAVREDLGEKMTALYATPSFFANMEPIPGAVEAVKEMSLMPNTSVFLCTSSARNFATCLPEKCQWVERNFGPEFLEKMIIVKDRTVLDGHLLFDDKENVTGIRAKPRWEHILMTANHNKNLELVPPRQRLDSWASDWKSILEKKRQELTC